MCLKGFEPPTPGLEGRCSIQLSYRHMTADFSSRAGDGNRTHVSSLEGWCSTIELHPHVVGVTGFEPATSWSQTRRSSQAEPHPVFFCRIAVVLPATQELLYGKPRILSTTFFKNFSNPCKPFIYAALRVLRILEYPSISQKFSAKLKSVPTFFPKKTMHLNPYSSK